MNPGTMVSATMGLTAIDSTTIDPQIGLNKIRPATMVRATKDLATMETATMDTAQRTPTMHPATVATQRRISQR